MLGCVVGWTSEGVHGRAKGRRGHKSRWKYELKHMKNGSILDLCSISRLISIVQSFSEWDTLKEFLGGRGETLVISLHIAM